VATRRRTLIVVSNRAPVSFARVNGERTAKRGAGGLVTALRSLVDHHDVTWVASAMTEEDRTVASEAEGGTIDERLGEGSSYRLRLVAHDEQAYDGFYNVVANPTLWFVQHYLWGLAKEPVLDHAFHCAWEDGYVAVNRSFARAVINELDNQPDAAVFFHDYHLYVAPTLVRRARPEAILSHFVHIPWPEPDYWSVLPSAIRRTVHAGLLANDVVGFHTRRWGGNFLRSCADVLGTEVDYERGQAEHQGRTVAVCEAAISVDPGEFVGLAGSEAVLEAERQLEASRPERLVLRVDRTDPSKNILRGFRAFELFLESHPGWRGRVSMLALLAPSRQEIPAYSDYLAAIGQTAAELNERFRQPDWTPIDLRIEDDFPRSVAAYKQYDVLLVNSVFDGLNLVAKEAPLVNERDGVLVLSENAGASEEIGEWALGVNPFDVAGQARALHEALSMASDERKRRREAICRWVREHSIEEWVGAQLAAIDEVQERLGRTLEAS
jgi:trehalose 6-phosphate synthase